jgi:4-hydroxythreonine-4-phosphate dehydrogenase
LSDAIVRIAVTPGEPAGIGPDLCLLLTQQTLNTELVVICDPALLEERAARLHIAFRYRLFDPAVPACSIPGEICVLPVPLQTNTRCGQLDPVNARYVLNTLDQAISGCQSGGRD